jgi:hypothetical protein
VNRNRRFREWVGLFTRFYSDDVVARDKTIRKINRNVSLNVNIEKFKFWYFQMEDYQTNVHTIIYLIDVWCFSATFSNISAISWRPVLVVEEAGIPRENHRPWASNW